MSVNVGLVGMRFLHTDNRQMSVNVGLVAGQIGLDDRQTDIHP